VSLLSIEKPTSPFLDWRVVTDPANWQADIAVPGVRHSEPCAHDAFPSDWAFAPVGTI
jgi:hypothetical protein